MDDIHSTAREWFTAKLINGATPMHIDGGQLDGLEYFPIEIDGVDYWLTDVGLFDPPVTGE